MKNKLIALAISLSLFSASCNTYMPAMRADATSRTMNLKVYFDITTTTQYGVPGAFYTRFPRIASKVQGFYFGAFSINLNFTNLKQADVISTEMSECLTEYYNTNFNRYCGIVDALCSSSHHTNEFKVRDDFFSKTGFNTSNCVAVYLSCGIFCHGNNSAHHTANGSTFTAYDFLEVRDSDYVRYNTSLADTKYINYTSEVLAHEIGHLYGVLDHYNTEYGDSRDNCIWGKNMYNESVAQNLSICSTCRETIMANADNYNHS